MLHLDLKICSRQRHSLCAWMDRLVALRIKYFVVVVIEYLGIAASEGDNLGSLALMGSPLRLVTDGNYLCPVECLEVVLPEHFLVKATQY